MRKNVKKNNKKRKLRKDIWVIGLFALSFLFFTGTRVGLKSYNITLQMKEQELAAQVNAKQEAVSELETEVNNLQNKTRLLGMLDSSVKDNQNNIYIMETK
ncbi:MAG: cell division protein FtsL [Floccifex sp.]